MYKASLNNCYLYKHNKYNQQRFRDRHVRLSFEEVVALKRAVRFILGFQIYARSPRIRRANWMSLGMMVTRLAWMAHRLVSSKRPTR